MPSGRDFNAGRRGGGTTKKNAFCSFCRKSYRDVGPLVEGPGDVYICGECIELCQSILEQERRRRGTSKQLFSKVPSPREIVSRCNDPSATSAGHDARRNVSRSIRGFPGIAVGPAWARSTARADRVMASRMTALVTDAPATACGPRAAPLRTACGPPWRTSNPLKLAT